MAAIGVKSVVLEGDLRHHRLLPGVRGAEHQVVRIARHALLVGVALGAAAARLVDHHDRLVEQLVLDDRRLDRAREIVGAAARTRRGDELDRLGRLPGEGRRGQSRGSDQRSGEFQGTQNRLLRLLFLISGRSVPRSALGRQQYTMLAP